MDELKCLIQKLDPKMDRIIVKQMCVIIRKYLHRNRE